MQNPLSDVTVRLAYLAYKLPTTGPVGHTVWIDAVAWAVNAIHLLRETDPQTIQLAQGVNILRDAAHKAFLHWNATADLPPQRADRLSDTWGAGVAWVQGIVQRSMPAPDEAMERSARERLVLDTLRPFYANDAALQMVTAGAAMRDLVAVAKAANLGRT